MSEKTGTIIILGILGFGYLLALIPTIRSSRKKPPVRQLGLLEEIFLMIAIVIVMVAVAYFIFNLLLGFFVGSVIGGILAVLSYPFFKLPLWLPILICGILGLLTRLYMIDRSNNF